MNRFDYLKSKCDEINKELKGCYLNKILEISSLDFSFSFSKSHSKTLFISLTSPTPFIKLDSKKINFSLSSQFLLNLKNKLLNSMFLNVSMLNEDSIYDFHFLKVNELYEKIDYHLYFECFKGNTNLILTNQNEIVLAFRYHSFDSHHPIILKANYSAPIRNDIKKEINENDEIAKENNYFSNIEKLYLKEKFNSLLSKLKRKRKSIISKKENLKEDLSKADEHLLYKEYADYFLMNQDSFIRGDSFFMYQDKKIPLKENYSFSDNLSYLYKQYKKAKQSLEITTSFLNKCEEDIDYIDSILATSIHYNEEDYEELIDELLKKDLIKIKQNKRNKKQIKAYKPYYFIYRDIKIAYGKNNLQNNELTFNLSSKEYTYIHIKNLSGSHIVIFSNNVDDELLELGLETALYLSNKMSSSFYVSKIKYCKKGDSLGKVNLLKYEEYQLNSFKFDIKSLIETSTRFN